MLGLHSMNPLIGLPQGTYGKEVVLELGICSGLLSGYGQVPTNYRGIDQTESDNKLGNIYGSMPLNCAVI